MDTPRQAPAARQSGSAPPESTDPVAGRDDLSAPPGLLLAQTAAGQSLLDEARAARAAGDAPRAVRSLERAIAIAPRDPVLWLELARTRQLQQRPDEAEDLAQRALEYADPASDASAACWTLIGDLRRQRGDAAGAREAYRQARTRS